MANVTVAVRAWQLLQQAEVALQNANYSQVAALIELARAYESFPSATDDDLCTAWFSQAVDPTNALLGVILTSQTVTAAATPTDAETAWVIGDGRSTTISNKALTTNVATLTTAGAHKLVVGQKITVAGVGAPFDGPFTITAVTTNTFSYACTNANITSAASTGTVTLNGLSVTIGFSSANSFPVTMTVDTAALAPVTFIKNVRVPYGS